MPKYKAGKQTEHIEFDEIIRKISRKKKHLNRSSTAFFMLLYYTGCRKSELYERVVQDCIIKEDLFIIDFHKRKKGSSEVPPLEIPLWFPGMKTVCEQLQAAKELESSLKLIERTTKGKRKRWREKKKWLFPNIHRTTADNIVKLILGKKYYPHFLRLNRITELCSNPEANIMMIKSFSGIKTLKVIETYMGSSKKQQRAAITFMGSQIKEVK